MDKRKKDDPEQSRRFEETAKEREAEGSEDDFERAIKRISKKPPPERSDARPKRI